MAEATIPAFTITYIHVSERVYTQYVQWSLYYHYKIMTGWGWLTDCLYMNKLFSMNLTSTMKLYFQTLYFVSKIVDLLVVAFQSRSSCHQ